MKRTLLAVALLLAGLVLPAAADDIDYTTLVKPILRKHCVECHGPRKRESSLRLDTIPLAIRGGARGPAIVAGKPQQSPLLQVVDGTHDELEMPPEGPGLTAAEVKTLAQWIGQGAKGPAEVVAAPQDPRAQHWSWQPIRRPELPPVRDPEWCRTAIDRFVLARMQAAGVEPSGQADRATLARRLSLDLLGLPPSPEQLQSFLDDTRPDAYQRLVDRLLASPHYGERWGRHWLDLARYGDSNGFTIDSARSIWPYRDWVINAINRGMPYDQFVIEQLAGDMLPSATREQIVATGFHRNTLRNEEGGTDREQFRVEAVVDRVNTTGTVFLGLTVGCAQCHDHKYDPITQREYYQLFAVLNNCSEPQIQLDTPQQKNELQALAKQLAAAQQQLKQFDTEQRPAWEQRLAAISEATWTILDPLKAESSAQSKLEELDDHSLLVSGGNGQPDTYTVVAGTTVRSVSAIRLEVLTDSRLPATGPGLAANGNFVLSRVGLAIEVDDGDQREEAQREEAQREEAQRVEAQRIEAKWASATADFAQSAYPIRGVIDDDSKTGWGIYGGTGKGHVATLNLSDPLEIPAGARLVFTLAHNAYKSSYRVGRFRLSCTDGPPESLTVSETVRQAARLPVAKRSAEHRKQLDQAYAAAVPGRAPLAKAVEAAKKRHDTLKKRLPTTLAMAEMPTPRETYVHLRGDFLNRGSRVTAGVPEILPPLNTADSQPPTRLDLARWLVDPSHPLTSRVTVNRHWQRFFGSGLVETENDFGVRGKPPSHPLLLDWLADRLVQTGWDTKALHRLIVTSAVYRQSSRYREDLQQIDPTDRLLARQRRLRLEAESVRDSALVAAGMLTTDIGGPSVYPPQPKGLDLFTQTRKNWKDSSGAGRYRRGLYTFFWRSNPHPFLMTFDAPDGNAACTRRARSNTPLQSLTLANDVTFVELAQALTTRLLHDTPDDTHGRIQWLVQRCLARPPTERERTLLLQFLDTQRKRYAENQADAEQFAPRHRPDGVEIAEAASWVAVARLLMNLDEFVTRE